MIKVNKKYFTGLLLLFIYSLGTTFLTYTLCQLFGLNKFMTGYMCGLSIMWLYKLIKV